MWGKPTAFFRRFISGARRRLSGWEHRLRHHVAAIKTVTAVFAAASVIAAVGCLLLLTAYTGYDLEAVEVKRMFRGFRFVQGVFLANVLFNLVFNLRRTLRESRPVKWVADIAVLLSAIPWAYPHPENPWIRWLCDVAYSNRFLIPVLGFYALVTLSYAVINLLGKRTNPSLMLGASFMFFIVIGSFLLMMPRCTYHGISFGDSLFVSTSAVCITGLTTVDVATTFTPLGLLVLAILIQIGGLGVMTFTSFFALFFSGNASVYSQLMIKDMVYTKSINSLLPTLLYILGFTLVVEGIGAVLLFWSVNDVLALSFRDRVVFAAFHSLSAFCNAGFSNIPGGLSNPALMNSNQSVYLVVSLIVMAGSMGFPILVNFRDALGEYFRRVWYRFTGRRYFGRPVHLYNVNTKVALATTLVIFAVSVVLFLMLESDNSLRGMNFYDKIVQAVFNSTTPRSSGFASVNPAGFLNVTLIFVMLLMWIGGAAQSTAGGIKVNTLAAILINLRAIVKGRDRVIAFDRTISIGSIRRANAVVTLSILSYAAVAMALLVLEPALPARSVLFEALSALFTVGSSLGITQELSDASKGLLIGAMFIGRVGLLSLLMGFAGTHSQAPVKYPTDNIIIN